MAKKAPAAKGGAGSKRLAAHEVFYKAMIRPTEKNVEAALSHSELEKALQGLTREDFEKLSSVMIKLSKTDRQAVYKTVAMTPRVTLCA